KRGSAHFLPEGGEVGRYCVGQGDARIGRPGAGRAGGSHIGRTLFGVDRDLRARSLQKNRGGQPEGAASNDSYLALSGGHCFFDGDTAGTPRERPATATVSIVMDDRLFADAFYVQTRSGCTKRTQAHSYPEDPVRMGADRHQLGEWLVCRGNSRRR